MNDCSKPIHPLFENYINMIIKHPSYKGLQINQRSDGSYTWVTTRKTEIGKQRIEWCKKKAKELGISRNTKNFYADVMFDIHPTKLKNCQICGKEMSLYYYYPNSMFLNFIRKEFNKEYTKCNDISYILKDLIQSGFQEELLLKKIIIECKLKFVVKIDEAINELERVCRKEGKKYLGPGAMSNFPDRFDGFHSYNRCCREKEDLGRSKENLSSYGQDRRAYEYWVDGNSRAADHFMRSQFFNNQSADHIGPISLGFVHESVYLQPMSIGNNSAKRDRISKEDIEKIIKIQKKTQICAISWYSNKIWHFIINNYKYATEDDLKKYRKILKQNISNFMYILFTILEKCKYKGRYFLKEAYLLDKYKNYFYFDYKFDKDGNIKSRSKRHFTKSSSNELERYCRKSIESIEQYNYKSNRNAKNDLTNAEHNKLENICNHINSTYIIMADIVNLKGSIKELIEDIQNRLIQN